MTTSVAEDGEEQDDRDDRLEGAGHAWPPTDPVAKGRADLGVEGDQLVDVRIARARAAAEPLDGRLEHPRDAEEIEGSREEAGHCDVVGGDQRSRGPRASDPGLARDAERRKAVLVGRSEIESRRRDQIGRSGG